MIGLLDQPTKGKISIDGIDTTTLNDNNISYLEIKNRDSYSNSLIYLVILQF